MLRSIILLIIIWCSQTLSAQYAPKKPYEKATFNDLSPLYHTTFHDKDFRDVGSDGYNCFADFLTVESVVHKNYYITIQYNRLNVFYFGNYYITCVNLDNGEVVWQNKIFRETDPNLEIPRLMEVDENNVLHIYGQKRKDGDNDKGFFYDLIFFERQYDLATGAFISLFHRPYDDVDAYPTFYQIDGSNLFFKDNNGDFRFVERFTKNMNVGFKSYAVDATGSLVSGPDTTYYEYFDDFVNGENIVHAGQDSLIMVEVGFDDENDEVFILKHLSYDLKILDRIVVKSPFADNLPNIRLVSISPDKSKMLLIVVQPPSASNPALYAHSIVVDKKGNILKQNKSYPNAGIFLDWWSHPIDFYTASTRNNIRNELPSKNVIEFNIVRNDFELETLKFHTIKDSIRTAGIAKLYRYNDKEIVVLNEVAYYNEGDNYRVDNAAYARSILSFNKGDFIPDGLLSSTEEDLQKNDVSLVHSYPNPSSGTFSIDIQGIVGKADIRFFDVNGRNVYVQNQISEGITTMDLSALSTGMYVYKIYQGNKEIGNGKWVKM